ncbi:hypothetical protein [Halomonas stenophila]|uniref:Uncharacterized protein n=1 Tax=Halomonas stenophila TaxID=795312 RepID=A0A7W5ETB0_9GAMM|nr:hypothetical protein [Halomonas stenophila]MBB3231059.1 hypothetical protein [Halomonas stenophila]
MTLDQLKQLINEQDEAQRTASAAVRPAHTAAMEAAQELREKLEGSTDQLAQRDALKAVVEAAAGKVFSTKASLPQAGIILGQHAAAAADRPGVPAAAGRDGKWLIAHAMSSTAGYSPKQRQQVVAALVLAANGAGIETGLIEFPNSWADFPSMGNLEQMAETMDPDAVAAMRAEQAEQAALLAEALRLEDALKQARPRLAAVGAGKDEMVVTVKNTRGGSIGVAGVTFEPGNNEVSAEQFAKVRGKKSFEAQVKDGFLEVVSNSVIVEEV